MSFKVGHQYARLKRRRKLSDTDVRAIFRSHRLVEDLAAEYGVARSTISKIKRGHAKTLVTRAKPLPRYLRGVRLELHMLTEKP
jgi:transcriptional regulator with XRE-family HTH domain